MSSARSCYRPIAVGTNDNSADEFIELRNVSTGRVNLFDSSNPTNTWKLTELVDYSFPRNISIPAGGSVLVANFDWTNELLVAAFRAKYGVTPETQIFGPYSGKLGNDGEVVRLYQPDTPEAVEVPYVLIDEVEVYYNNLGSN